MKKNYILSVSYGNYTRSIGGTDKVILAHQQMFNESDFSYLYIYPLNLSNEKPLKNNKFWGLIVDGIYQNVYTLRQLVAFFSDINSNQHICNCIHIHHLRNVNITELYDLVACFDCKIYMYIHDYYTICTSTKLLNFEGKLCSNGFLNKPECKKCLYFANSILFVKKFEDFVEKLYGRINFVCPSDAAKKWFLKRYYKYKNNTVVLYHQTFDGQYTIPIKKDNSIKIGFVGTPIESKGWTQFKRLYKQYGDVDKYEFIYFSSVIDASVNIKNVSVNFQSSLNAMVDALRKENVDFVLLCSIWPETYSYTYYESFSAGSIILTNKDSGNIADQVRKMKSGYLLTEDELVTFFNDFNKVLNIRKSYITEKKSVCLNLNENFEIVVLSKDNKARWVGKKTNTGHLNPISKILNFLYKYKLRKENN